MRHYPIYVGYDPTRPVGFVQIRDDDDAVIAALPHAAIVPAVRVSGRTGTVQEFGLVTRTMVDTRPEPRMGEDGVIHVIRSPYRTGDLTVCGLGPDHIGRQWVSDAQLELESPERRARLCADCDRRLRATTPSNDVEDERERMRAIAEKEGVPALLSYLRLTKLSDEVQVLTTCSCPVGFGAVRDPRCPVHPDARHTISGVDHETKESDMKLDFNIEGGTIPPMHDAAIVLEDESPFEALRTAVWDSIRTDLMVTVSGVTMFAAAWEDPEHWESDWVEKLGVDREDVVDAVMDLLAKATKPS